MAAVSSCSARACGHGVLELILGAVGWRSDILNAGVGSPSKQITTRALLLCRCIHSFTGSDFRVSGCTWVVEAKMVSERK
jgi:hypothetical protein